MPLMSTRMPRMGNVPVQPAPLGYMDRLPGRLALDDRAAARRVETRIALREELPRQPAAGELAVARPAVCANCGASGHRWHEGTLQACPGGVPLKDPLAREAQAWARAKANPKAAGGAPGVRGGGHRGAKREGTTWRPFQPGSRRQTRSWPSWNSAGTFTHHPPSRWGT